jgi:AcrR family transcriptional regulator
MSGHTMNNDQLLDHENAEHILQEGWRLFQQKGYRGVSLDELCLVCKITKPTLYYYFHDKETLFVRVLQHQLRGFHAVIERPGLLRERLEGVAESILTSFQSEYSVLLRDREHIKDPEHAAAVRSAFREEMFDPLIRLMRQGVEEKTLTANDPWVLTLIFLGSINNFIGKADEMHSDNQALSRLIVGIFMQGAQAKS